MTDGKIGVGIVGAGYWGPNLIRTFNSFSDCVVRGVCEAKPGRQAYVTEKFPDVCVTPKLDELLDDPELHVIVVATPVSTHYQLAMAALSCGKHVLVEKPLASSSEEAERMTREAQLRNLILGVDHLFVYNPAVFRMKELIDRGQVGSLCYAESGRVNLGPPASEVNVIWDLATHDLSMTYYLWGKLPKQVTAHGRSYLHPTLIDAAFIHLRFEDETVAVHHVSWLCPEKTRRYFVAGKSGSLLFDDTIVQGKLKQIDQGVDSRIGLKDNETKELFYRPGNVLFPELETVSPLEACCRHFLDCVRSGARPRADGSAGVAVVKMIEAAEQSIREGGKPVELRS